MAAAGAEIERVSEQLNKFRGHGVRIEINDQGTVTLVDAPKDVSHDDLHAIWRFIQRYQAQLLTILSSEYDEPFLSRLRGAKYAVDHGQFSDTIPEGKAKRKK